MTPIRILHIMNNFADSSISRIVERIVSGVNHDQYEWHVGDLSGYGEMESALQSLGAETVHFSHRQAEGPAPQRLGAYIRQHRIQIVHTHTPRAILSAFLAYKKGVHHVATKHLLTTSKDRRWGALYSAFDYLTLYLPNRIVPVSQTMAKQVRELPGMREERVTPVRNAIPCDAFYRPEKRRAIRRQLGFAPGQLTFGFAGRLDPVKRIDLLLEAFARFYLTNKDARLLLVGDGSERTVLEQQARQIGIAEAVIFAGHRTDIAGLLAAMDVYVQSSINEGLSLSILEAMAAGKAIIATDVGGAREVLRHRQNGLLIEPNSVEALFAAMVDLTTHPLLRIRMGEAARQYCFEEFCIEKMVYAYEQIYKSLVQ